MINSTYDFPANATWSLIRARAIGGCLLIALGLGVCFTSTADAELVSMVTTDTPTMLDVSWTWTEDGFELDAVTGPALTNWDGVIVTIGNTGGQWTVASIATHVVNPHGGDTLPAGEAAMQIDFLDNSFGMLTTFATVSHPAIGHVDEWSLSVTHNENHVNTIRLTASHVPEPASFAMFGIAMLGMAGRRRQS